MGTGAAAAVLNLSHKPISLMETQGWGREEKEVFSLFLLLVALSIEGRTRELPALSIATTYRNTCDREGGFNQFRSHLSPSLHPKLYLHSHNSTHRMLIVHCMRILYYCMYTMILSTWAPVPA